MNTKLRLTLTSLLLTAAAQAAPIVGVVASSPTGGTGFLNQIVNGSGLTGNLHAQSDEFNAFASFDDLPTFNFNLGGSYSLDSISIWNHFNFSISDRSTQDLDILTSTDNVTYTSLGTFTLSQPSTLTISPDVFNFAPVTASFVRFNVLSIYTLGGRSGLSEVVFNEASLVPPGAPELDGSPVAPLFMGLALLALRGRRRS